MIYLDKDIDWTRSDARATAVIVLDSEFAQNPMMNLFSDESRRRLALYVAEGLAGQKPKSMYHAVNYVEFTLIPTSIYGVFGKPLAGMVGYIVQKSLYPTTYKRDNE